MDQPKRRTRPGVGFVLLVFALVAGLSLGATAALPMGHSAASSGVGAASAPAAPMVKPVSGASHTSAAYPANAYLRVFQANPDAGAIDTYLNGTLGISNLAYGTYSGYDPLFPGAWNVSVYPTGSTPVPANLTLTADVNLLTSQYYTFALTGNATNVSYVLLNDSNTAPAALSFSARFFDASYNMTAVNLTLTNVTVLAFNDLNFTNVSAYASALNNTYDVNVSWFANSTVALPVGNVTFSTNDYTLALIGYNNSTTAPLALVILLDGSYSMTPSGVYPVAAAMTQLTPLSTYTVLPTNFVFSYAVTNASILTTNTFLWLNVTDFASSALCESVNLSSAVYDVAPSVVYYPSVPIWGTVAVATWAVTLTSDMVVNTTACPNFASDPAIISVAAVTTDPANGTGSSASSQQTSFVWLPVSSQLHVSTSPAAPTTFSISANYSSQYVGRVALSVFNPTTGLVTFSANLIWVGNTPTTVTWIETTAGAYPYVLSVFTAFGVFNTSGTINVLPGTATFYNSTTWTNATLVSGLSPAAAGTLLLIVGLLIGMIVAMVVGRMVWGGPKQVAPAQPWSQKPAAGANTCSVCGQSFNTPEELAAHSKSEHGMQ